MRIIYSKLWRNYSRAVGLSLVLSIGLLWYAGLAQAQTYTGRWSGMTNQWKKIEFVVTQGPPYYVTKLGYKFHLSGSYCSCDIENTPVDNPTIINNNECIMAESYSHYFGYSLYLHIYFDSANECHGTWRYVDNYCMADNTGTFTASKETCAEEICNNGIDDNCNGQVDEEGCQECQITVPDDYSTIQGAIAAASNGCEIIVRDGTYVENINFGGKAITIRSENGATTTIIDGNTSGSVVTFDSNESLSSVLNGFTISGNSANADGGGIYCSSSSPTIINCTISGNSTSKRGGGIYCSSSSPTITNCTISSNTASYGGGAIYCFRSSPTITNCTISNNRSNASGGGIFCWDSSSPIIENCTISSNSANGWGGGGIYCWQSSSPVIENCTISNNLVTGDYSYGGGIYCEGSSPTIHSCTISGNSTTSSGGGIYCWASSTLTVTNSILWENTAGWSFNEIYLANGSTLNITYSDIEGGWTGTGNTNSDPLFVSGANYHLTAGSPCIDTGTSTGAPSDDIDGDSRPQGSGYDMGADEYVGISLTTGWNLISLSQQPSDIAIEFVLSSISGKYASVWAFINNAWKVYDPANPGFSDLLTMEAGWGYWIKMTEAANFSISGTTPSDTIPLVSGWNLAGYNSTSSQDIADALASIDTKYVSVWAFIDGGWKVYDPASPGFSDLLTMEPDYGYWINTTQACTWRLP